MPFGLCPVLRRGRQEVIDSELSAFEARFDFTATGEQFFKEIVKPWPVVGMFPVAYFVSDHVVDADEWGSHQFRIETNVTVGGATLWDVRHSGWAEAFPAASVAQALIQAHQLQPARIVV